jgi:uncharacterized FAD-dependent dehydrogenase
MIKITNLKLPFDHRQDDLLEAAAKKLGLSAGSILSLTVKRCSLDARANRPLSRVYSLLVTIQDEKNYARHIAQNSDLAIYEERTYQIPNLNFQGRKERPLIIGTGPAGTFAGLILAEAGFHPLLIERGKKARQRVKDVNCFWEKGDLDQESNVQFGEGGAGTFSDGKLTTRVKDKHRRIEKILQELVAAGAPPEIMVEAKPHVGTANLVRVVENLRKKIETLGGEYRFESRVDDLILEGDRAAGVILSSGERITASTVVLAIGHSARDTFNLLQERGLKLAPKPFSVGFRIEHPQLLIDRKQFGDHAGHPALGAADYQLSYRTSLGRTVYSFCMCPGGYVIGASSEYGGLVTNGMSQYSRDGVNANSAIVAEVIPGDFPDDPLEGFRFQQNWEQKAFTLGGEDYCAPVQMVEDFFLGKISRQLGGIQPTYQPGVRLVDLNQLLPYQIREAIREALEEFNQRITGFSGPDAILTGIETRTSCPVRILRGKDGQSISIQGIYPVGEGSGYAGGIISSAIDGIKSAENILTARGKRKNASQ